MYHRSYPELMLSHSINHNAHKIAFWIFTHLACDKALADAIRFETSQAISPDGTMHVETLLNDCPQLDAVWYEVLRLYNNAALARKATVNTTISGKSVSAGETVLGPFRHFHLNPEIVGSSPLCFDKSRFLLDKRLQSRKGYHPFGGGNTYCPGRFFARSEIYVFVATVLDRLEVRAADGEEIPEVDLETPSSSAMPAVRDVIVNVEQR